MIFFSLFLRYCNDYDVELVDMDPDSGDVIGVAVLLVTATPTETVTSQNTLRCMSHNQMTRHLHQATLKFFWNVDTGHCQVRTSN